MTRVLPDSELEAFPALEWSGIAERMSSESRNALDQVIDSARALDMEQIRREVEAQAATTSANASG